MLWSREDTGVFYPKCPHSRSLLLSLCLCHPVRWAPLDETPGFPHRLPPRSAQFPPRHLPHLLPYFVVLSVSLSCHLHIAQYTAGEHRLRRTFPWPLLPQAVLPVVCPGCQEGVSATELKSQKKENSSHPILGTYPKKVIAAAPAPQGGRRALSVLLCGLPAPLTQGVCSGAVPSSLQPGSSAGADTRQHFMVQYRMAGMFFKYFPSDNCHGIIYTSKNW